MAGLDMGAGEVLDEEARIHVHEGLFHLMFFRNLIRRTGLIEEAENVGWLYGDPMYLGVTTPWEMESDHLNRLLAILDLPGEQAWIDDCMAVGDGEYSLVDVETGEKLVGDEEDLTATIYGEQADLDRLVRLLHGLKPDLIICRLESEEESSKPVTLAEAWNAEEQKPHVTILLHQQGQMYSGEIYSGLFELLIQVWEVTRNGDRN